MFDFLKVPQESRHSERYPLLFKSTQSEAPHLCDAGCKQIVTGAIQHRLIIDVRSSGLDEHQSNRVLMRVWRAFCSAGCREAWWLGGDTLPMFLINNPATLDVRPCPTCTDEREYNRRMARMHWRGWRWLSERSAWTRKHLTVLSLSELDAIPIRSCICATCNGQGFIRRTPDFFYSEDGQPGWQPEWARRVDFDRELVVSVFETRPPQQIVRSEDWRSYLVEQYLFSTPLEINAWWRKEQTQAELLELRQRFVQEVAAQPCRDVA